MKRLIVAVLVVGLMLGQVAASRAITFTITVTSTTNWTTTGITSDAGFYTNTLVPFTSGVGDTSALSFGITLTNENTATRPSSDTFTGTSVQFEFDVVLNENGATHHYLVDGTFVGLFGSPVAKMTVNAAGFGESQAAFRANSVTVDGTTVFTTLDTSPTGIPSIKTVVDFGSSITVTLWVDRRDQLTAPGDFSTLLSVGGFIQAAVVPESGPLALLLGSGVSGSLLFLRRRRRI